MTEISATPDKKTSLCFLLWWQNENIYTFRHVCCQTQTHCSGSGWDQDLDPSLTHKDTQTRRWWRKPASGFPQRFLVKMNKKQHEGTSWRICAPLAAAAQMAVSQNTVVCPEAVGGAEYGGGCFLFQLGRLGMLSCLHRFFSGRWRAFISRHRTLFFSIISIMVASPQSQGIWWWRTTHRHHITPAPNPELQGANLTSSVLIWLL